MQLAIREFPPPASPHSWSSCSAAIRTGPGRPPDAVIGPSQLLGPLTEQKQVVALSELGQSWLAAKEQLQWGPAEVRQSFWKSRCGLALSWRTAADRWKAITDRLGRDGQRSAYLHSLGLDP